eukprot:m.10927 g.10927  ORF g.10927 m.10927 type:complete len:137 (+) comp8558_c0_seq1:87-497(+)
MDSHPKFVEFSQLALRGDAADSEVAWLSYLELTAGKLWNEVHFCFSDKLRKMFLVGKPSQTAQFEVVLPVGPHTVFSFESITNHFDTLFCDVGAEKDCRTDSITMAITDADSTSSYYRIFRGLRAPLEKTVCDDDE